MTAFWLAPSPPNALMGAGLRIAACGVPLLWTPLGWGLYLGGAAITAYSFAAWLMAREP